MRCVLTLRQPPAEPPAADAGPVSFQVTGGEGPMLWLAMALAASPMVAGARVTREGSGAIVADYDGTLTPGADDPSRWPGRGYGL